MVSPLSFFGLPARTECFCEMAVRYSDGDVGGVVSDDSGVRLCSGPCFFLLFLHTLVRFGLSLSGISIVLNFLVFGVCRSVVF